MDRIKEKPSTFGSSEVRTDAPISIKCTMVVIDMDTVQRKIDKKMEDGLKDLHFARNGSTE